VNGKRSVLLLLTGAIAAVTLAFSASPAFAASSTTPVSGAQAHSTAEAQASASPQEGTVYSSTSSSSVTAATEDTTGDPCATYTVTVTNKDIFGIILFSFHMVTYFCWNGVIVTSHDTSVGAGVTATGVATGWEYVGDTGIDFYCYTASGSTRNCSGNSESSRGYFYNVLTGESVNNFINQFETYTGAVHYTWSSNF
jgi:hypothetical protein